MAPETMHGQALALGDQLRSAAPLARGVLDGAGPFRNVCLCGLGGSAAGARLATALLADDLELPVDIPVGPRLPGWVGPDTLVVVTSYSGETLEALDWFEEAGARGATRAVVGSGGTLAARADDAGAPAIVVEGGWQPRGALGLLLAPLLVLLREAGAAPDPEELIASGADAADAAALRDDEAREMAGRLAGNVAVLYGSGMRAAVAVRLKNQLNENAKVAAFAGAIPEIAHNEILGWLQTPRATQRHTAIFLRDHAEPKGVATLADALARCVLEDGAGLEPWTAEGPDERSRAFGLLVFGDLVSCHLADVEGVDAMDIARLKSLKATLAADR
jgi:glucose/mannose-6-phosphate isomerase